MAELLFIAWWLGCDLASYGLFFATCHRVKKGLRCQDERRDAVLTCGILSAFGPLSLILAISTTRCKDGWRIEF